MTRLLLPVIALTVVASPATVEARGASRQNSKYSEISAADIANRPIGFDGMFVRVRGYCRIEFEGNILWVTPEARAAMDFARAIWLDVDWLPSDALKAMDGHEVIVEARFDARRTGHMGCCRGTLTDVRSIWRPGVESSAFTPNYQTRSDALEQLEFKTGWIELGMLAKNGQWTTDWFEFVKKADRRSRLLPRRGDTIRPRDRVRIHIVDYATRGEQRRLEPPMAHGPREASAETRLWLAAGTELQVEQVHAATLAGGLRYVWGRVVPVNRAR